VSRIAPLSEKVLATEAAFTALMSEIDTRVDRNDARVQVAIINAAVTIAMATDTRDLGILSPERNPLRLDNLDGTTGIEVTDG